MSDYLSLITARSSGVAPDNAVSPQGGVQSHSTSAFTNDIVEEGRDIVPETRITEPDAPQNPLDKRLMPDTPIQTVVRKESVVNEQKPKDNTAPTQYLSKHVERWATENTEKPVFYNRTEIIRHSEVKDSDFAIDSPIVPKQQSTFSAQSYLKPQIQAIDGQTLNKEERQKNILTPNTEGGNELPKKTADREGRKFNPLKPVLPTNETPNERIKLRPATLALETPMVKKTAASPKLVIGRITVQVIPPVSPPVKTIVRTVERGGGAAATSGNTIHKLSFGLGQL